MYCESVWSIGFGLIFFAPGPSPLPFSAASVSGSRLATTGQVLRQLAPTGLSLLAVLVFILLAMLYAVCTQYIEPDQFAVKQVDVTMPLLTGAAGIHTNIYDTGIRWRMPGFEKFKAPLSDESIVESISP